SERGRGSYGQLAMGVVDGRERAHVAQADEPGRLEHAGLHHEHERSAASNRPHRRIVGIEQPDGFLEGRRLGELERGHWTAPLAGAANAAASRDANCFSISRAFERSTGWPRLPSLPVSAASTAYAIFVSSPTSLSVVCEVAVMRPTTPSGVPSTFASISVGGSARLSSTVTLKLNFMYATLVSNTAA